MTRPDTSVAIVGLSCRFPGAPDEAAFWSLLREGREGIRSFSRTELEAAGIDAAELDDPSYVRAGGVLDDIEMFDASFFGYSPAEAETMDPQHRLFLETSWAALENAGHRPRSFDGPVGVWAGSSLNTYQLNNLLAGRSFVASMEDLQALLSSDKDFLASRVSYKLDLTGPSMVVQTACSTSLVAVCQACQALLDYQCDLALAGGVSVRVPQRRGYRYRPDGILSPDGHCRPFDAAGQGTVFGNGVGVVVLRRLDEALADGDRVRAVIRGWAVNNDGSTKVGFTAPSVDGHAEVVALAQALAGIDASTVGYVEGHGTATALGDPIEVTALSRAFRAHTDEHRFCALGSVKSNIGHLDAAAGVAGLIKTILALEHRQIPPTLHFETPNPETGLDSSPFYVASALGEWPGGATPRRAGVSSLGIGGTNAHVVLEEAPPRSASSRSRSLQLLPISAGSETALETATTTLADHLDPTDVPDRADDGVAADDLADIAFTLQLGREELAHRHFAVCRDTREAVARLRDAGPTRRPMSAPVSERRDVIFLFPGQGSQYAGMARDLYGTEPAFREQLDRCARMLESSAGIELSSLLRPEPARSGEAELLLERTALCQPALFAIEYALARLLVAWGLRPRAMIGHSLGEYVAATLAGVLSLEDALTLVAERGRLMQELPPGSMLAVALPATELESLLPSGLALAADNAPTASVVSGPTPAVEELEERLTARGTVSRRLRTSHAFHSPMMEPVMAAFAERVRAVPRRPPTIPYASNLTGGWIEEHQIADPEYWSLHLRRPVLFSAGLRTVLAEGSACLVEIGPGRTLLGLAALGGDDRVAASVPTLPAGDEERPDDRVLWEGIGRLWLEGVEIDWRAVHDQESLHRVPLPTYPFDRQRHWIDPPATTAPPTATSTTTTPRLPIDDWFHTPVWRLSREAPAESLRGDRETWAVFTDSLGLGDELARRLGDNGRAVVVIRRSGGTDGDSGAGNGLERLGDGEYSLRPGARTDYLALLDELAARGRTPRHIAHLWAVSDRAEADTGRCYLEEGFFSLLFLAQAFGECLPGAPLDVFYVSSDLHPVTGRERPIAEKAVALGPCRVLPQESPHRRCRAVDVPADAARRRDPELVDLLAAELTSRSTESIVALRPPDRWVPELEPVRLEPTPDCGGLRDGGHYLITGGTGGMGLALGDYLAGAVRAPRLTLIARTPVPPRPAWDTWLEGHDEDEPISRRIRALRHIESLGAEVAALAADVADRRQAASALESARQRFGPVHGVVHAAGVAGGGLAQLRSRQEAEAVLAPKVRGTRVLTELLGDEPDFVVLCSSIAAVLGGVGQVDYCGANAFLDAVPTESEAAGSCRILTVAWDTWRDVGMAVESSVPPQLESRRQWELRSGIGRDEGGDVLCRALGSNMRGIVVSTRDIGKRIEASTTATDEGGTAERSAARSAGELPPRSGGSLEAEVARIWSETLGIERIGPSDNFFELGGQSLQAVTIFAEIDQRLSVRLPLATLFKAPTVEQLADLVRDARTEEADSKEADSWSSLVPMRIDGAKTPLFLISGLNLLLYRDLARLLGDDQPVYGLQAVGLDGSPPPFTSIEQQATHYVGQIRSVQSEGPFLIGGKSAHGMIALEMARKLRAEGEKALVVFIDTLAPDYYHANRQRRASLRYLTQRVRQIFDNQREILAALGLREQLRYAAGKGLFLVRRFGRKLRNRLFPKALDRVERAYRKASWEYRPEPYSGRVVLFRATHQRPDFAHDPKLGWGELIEKLEVREVAGYHASILMEPRVRGLAEKLAAVLEREAGGQPG